MSLADSLGCWPETSKNCACLFPCPNPTSGLRLHVWATITGFYVCPRDLGSVLDPQVLHVTTRLSPQLPFSLCLKYLNISLLWPTMKSYLTLSISKHIFILKYSFGWEFFLAFFQDFITGFEQYDYMCFGLVFLLFLSILNLCSNSFQQIQRFGLIVFSFFFYQCIISFCCFNYMYMRSLEIYCTAHWFSCH